MRNWRLQGAIAVASVAVALCTLSGCSGDAEPDSGFSDHQLDRVKVGPHEFFVFKNDTVISRRLKFGGLWNGNARALVARFGRGDPMNVLDIGAYIGTFSVTVATLPQVEKVFAFEPMTIGVLKKNIKLNHVQSKVIPYEYGAGKEEGIIHVKRMDYDADGNFGGQSLKDGHAEKALEPAEDLTPVRVVTVDSLNLQNIGFIKIDVEGMELEVLEGMEETVRANGLPPIMIEIWGTVAWRKEHSEYYAQNAANVHEKLISLGYDRALNLKLRRWNTPSWPERDGDYIYVRSTNPGGARDETPMAQ